jgi:hypothetical protein
MAESSPETIPAPEPSPIPPAPQVTPQEEAKPSRKVLVAILLIAVIAGAIGFAYVYTQTNLLRPSSSAATHPLSGYNTYSNHGFSFQYPKTWTISEHGLLDNSADSNSGLVTAQSTTSQNDLVLVGWNHSVNTIDPSTVLTPAINGFQKGSGGTNLVIGQQGTTTTTAGYSVLYQPFSITVSGTTVNAVWSAWYSTHGQRLYQLSVVTSGPDAMTSFNTYLSSFAEQ